MSQAPPAGPVKARSRLYLPAEDKKADIPDLLLTFGSPVTDVWLIEAKIKSGESSDQLLRYEKEAAKTRMLAALELEQNTGTEWHYSYLTLEGDRPARAIKFEPITYEPLCSVLPAEHELSMELLPAYACLRNRFREYYDARSAVLESDASIRTVALKKYLSDIRGLIDEKSKFHWLMRRITEELGMQPTITHAQSPGSSALVCQMRDLDWQSVFAYGVDRAALYECFDIHLELQLAYGGDDLSLTLHYHTNPYIQGVRKRGDIPIEERKVHQERREAFAHILGRNSEALENSGWKLTSPSHVNQLAKYVPNFALSGTVGDLRGWVQKAGQAIRPAVYDAAKGVVW